MEALASSGIGNPVNRVEGRLKVTGKARYASEFPVENVVYAHAVNSTIAKGEITSIDTTEAKKQEGVIEVITYKNAMRLKTYDEEMPQLDLGNVQPVLQNARINYFGEYIGLVIAETFEQARYAARLVRVEYKKEVPKINFKDHRSDAQKSNTAPNHDRGDVAAGFSEADEIIEQTYNTPIEHHHPMELHAIIAYWDEGKVKAYASQQIMQEAAKTVAKTFQISQDNIHMMSPYVGGGFGSKLMAKKHVILAIMAAKMVNRPVQLTVTRQQMFTNTTMRQYNEQSMKLGAKKDGTFTAIVHNILSHTSTYEEYQEPCGTISKMFYNFPNATILHEFVPVNLQTPYSMRAPGEATGSFALESAIDELAWKLRMDPIELRIKNDTQTDPSNGKPFSSRYLKECLRIGAEKFGWNKRSMEPGMIKEGNWLKGMGVSGASRAAPISECSSRIKLELKGGKLYVTLEMDATDIGTGSYSIIAQTASEYLNIPVDTITVNIGDSTFPVTPGSGGSWGAASYANGVRAACLKVIDGLKKKANVTDSDDVDLQKLMSDGGLTEFEATGKSEPSETLENYSVYSFGANFAEVWVDKDTGVFRIQRMLNVGDCGIILNPKTAYGQVIGGMTMGAGMVIAEQTHIEPNFGNCITRSLADYHVPVNLDMANTEVVFLQKEDKIANEIGIKGIGELGITSVAAAITNAIFNATGKRMRDLPVTPDKLISALSM